MKNLIDVVKELEKNLETKYVKQRKGAHGMTLDYLEGWHVITEMNRIFGHDGWGQTIKINHSSGEGRTCSVIASVKLTLYFKDHDPIEREDVGFGNGDMELAHKEAITDAFKRAARTLGYPLGLALYDKEKLKVGEPTLSKKDARVVFGTLEQVFRMATSKEDLKQCAKDNAEVVKTLPEDWKQHVREEYTKCMEALDK